MGDDLQQQSFAMLPRVRREVATIDLDSSIHEVYGEKKEGADFAYNNTWSYSVLYGTLAETGDLLYMDLREGYRHHQLRQPGRTTGNDQAGGGTLSGGADARRQWLL